MTSRIYIYISALFITLGLLSPMFAHALTTPAATAFQTSCAAGPSYPQMWEWDGAKTLQNAPQSATAAMGLTPKVEQYRNGQLIATYSTIGATASVCSANIYTDRS